MRRELSNYAYIDANNLFRGINSLGWKLDYKKFRKFLSDRHGVSKAYLFMGFIPENEDLYRRFENWDYVLVFKTVGRHRGMIKGNCDGEFILQAMADACPGSSDPFERAVIVTGDGDFACLINYLEPRGKLEILLSPSLAHCSALLKLATPQITFLEDLKSKLELKTIK